MICYNKQYNKVLVVVKRNSRVSCCVCLQVQDALQIEVSDDGKGFEEAERVGVGLTSMREWVEAIIRARDAGLGIPGSS